MRSHWCLWYFLHCPTKQSYLQCCFSRISELKQPPMSMYIDPVKCSAPCWMQEQKLAQRTAQFQLGLSSETPKRCRKQICSGEKRAPLKAKSCTLRVTFLADLRTSQHAFTHVAGGYILGLKPPSHVFFASGAAIEPVGLYVFLCFKFAYPFFLPQDAPHVCCQVSKMILSGLVRFYSWKIPWRL